MTENTPVTIEKEGNTSYITRNCPIKIGDMTINASGAIFVIPDAEAVEMATKQKHLVLIPYIKSFQP